MSFNYPSNNSGRQPKVFSFNCQFWICLELVSCRALYVLVQYVVCVEVVVI